MRGERTAAGATGQAPADRLARAGLVVTVGVIVAGTAAQLANYAFSLKLGVLDSSRDGGAFGLAGDIAAGCAALAAWIVLGRVRPRPKGSAALAVLLTSLALDKALRLHDAVPHWPAYYLPILAATLAALLAVARRLPRPSWRFMAFALTLLAVSLLIHFTGEAILQRLGSSDEGLAYQLKGAIKHAAEVGGWLMVSLSLALGALTAAEGGTRTGVQPPAGMLGRRPTPKRQPSASR